MTFRVVLDTNVLVSGLLATSGSPRKLFDSWLEGNFALVMSLFQIDELHRVLTYPRIIRRLRLSETELAIIYRTFEERAEIISGELDLAGATRDPKDDAILACAISGQVNYLVSGDDDLLVLGSYSGVRIVTPKEFVTILAEESS